MLTASKKSYVPGIKDVLDEVRKGEPHVVMMLLDLNPLLLQIRSREGYTLLDSIIITGAQSPLITAVLGKYEANNQIDIVLNAHNGYDDTILHLAAKYCELKVIRHLIQLLGKKSVLMCQSTNIDGKTPLLIVDVNPFKIQHGAIKAALLEESLKFRFLPLSHVIDINEVLNNFPDEKDDPQTTRIISACVNAANQSRKNNLYSSTHPQCNDIDIETFNDVWRKIISVRTETQSIPIMGDLNDVFAQLSVRAAIIRDQKAGNCSELAEDTLVRLLCDPSFFNVTVGMASLQANARATGDHAFLVIHRMSHPNNPILVDPFCGTITRVNPGFYTSLLSFYQFENHINLLAYPNKKFAGHNILTGISFISKQKPSTPSKSLMPADLKNIPPENKDEKLLSKFSFLNKSQPTDEIDHKDPLPTLKLSQ